MSPLTVTLFYKYCTIPDVPAAVAAQQALLSSLALRGRIRVAPEGINATACGAPDAVAAYEAATAAALGGGVDFKRSACTAQPFVDARVRAVDEVVTMGVAGVSAGAGAEKVSPAEFRARVLAQQRGEGESLVVLDVRNGYESDIGCFAGAVRPPIRQFSEFPAWAVANRRMLCGKEVFMFCTGGVRCEKASAFLIERVGVERGSVRQLDGGIMGFLERVDGGGGVWRGKNLVFDGRLTDQGSGDIVGRCVGCEVGCDDYGHGARCVHCRRRLLVCEKVECAAPRLCGPCGEACESGTLRKAGRVRAKLEALAG